MYNLVSWNCFTKHWLVLRNIPCFISYMYVIKLVKNDKNARQLNTRRCRKWLGNLIPYRGDDVDVFKDKRKWDLLPRPLQERESELKTSPCEWSVVPCFSKLLKFFSRSNVMKITRIKQHFEEKPLNCLDSYASNINHLLLECSCFIYTIIAPMQLFTSINIWNRKRAGYSVDIWQGSNFFAFATKCSC